MPSIILKKYSEPESLNRVDLSNLDSSTPYSYEEWVKRNFGITPDNTDIQYQNYLLRWYDNKNQDLTQSTLREDYVNLLKRVSYIFKDDPNFRKFSTIDFDDNLQLKLAVPYYVKKLKEIALYYKNKRESIRRAKMKYNMVGSLNAVERTFYEYILKAFTKRDYVLNVPSQTAWNAFQDLSAINTGFSIEIEELYDDTDYFDDRDTLSYSYELSSTNPLLFVLEDILNEYNDNIPLSALQSPYGCVYDTTLSVESLKIANSKYIGTDKFYLSGGYFAEDSYNLELPFEGGNNFFYWFSGEYFKEAPHPNFLPISLNSLDWIQSGATSSPVYSSSDIIFVNNNGNIEGAWLANYTNEIVDDTMKVNIRNNKTFKYPYPGIGVSAEGLEWTGKQVIESPFFEKTFFPNQTIKNKVENELTRLYWTNTPSISTVRPIRIHDTTLVDSGAFASKRFHLADKIIARLDTSDKVHDYKINEIFENDLTVDWLYDFDRTQLPITTGLNNIYWPIQTYDSADDIHITYPWGDSIALNAIDSSAFTGSVAGTKIENADMLFRLESECGPITEAAWLKGAPLSAFNSCKTETVTGLKTSTLSIPDSEITIPWTPAKVDNLIAWWDSSKVTTDSFGWADELDYKPFDIIGTSVPEYNESKEFLSFTGQMMKNTGYFQPLTQPFTVGVIFNPSEVEGNFYIFDRQTSPSAGMRINKGKLELVVTHNRVTKILQSDVTISKNTWYFALATFNGANSKLTVNGTTKFGTLGSTELYNIVVGAKQDKKAKYNGKLRDIVVFDGSVTPSNEQLLLTYFQTILNDSPTRPEVTRSNIVNQLVTYNITKSLVRTYEATIGEYTDGAFQAGLMFKANPNEVERFIWTGVGNGPSININDPVVKGFSGHVHDDTCPYKNINPKDKLKITDKSTVNDQWKLCSCGAIYYSPLGHTGNTFRSGGISDYIILDTSFPIVNSLDDWKGDDGRPWNTSEDFAWFKLDPDQPDKECGWGKGRWVTNSGVNFRIKPGRNYLYHRAGVSNVCNSDTPSPFFIAKFEHCNCTITDCECRPINCKPKWYRADMVDGVWVDSGVESNMVMVPGNHYQYDHKTKNKFSMIATDNIEYSDCTKSTNFLLSVKIPNLKPYWGVGTFDKNTTTKNKGLMYGGERNDFVFDYLKVSIPKPSDLMLTDDLYLRYEHNTKCASACFIWEQPLVWDVKFEKNSWNKLEIDNCVQSDISHFIQNNNCETCFKLQQKCPSCCESDNSCGCILDECITTTTGITATDEISPMLLRTGYDFKPVFVNYYAQNPFILPITVVDTTLGLPPSGGKWIPETIINYAESQNPMANIASLFNPFIASTQSTDLLNKKNVGFFLPERLGFTNLILNDKVIGLGDIETRSASSNDIVISNDHYVSGPYEVTYTNSEWMKSTSQCNSGQIKNSSTYQELVPYQTSFETLKNNSYGIQSQSDIKSPWVGKNKNVFISDSRYPSNIKGEYPENCGPNSWYNTQPDISGTLYNWRTDVYGNQYGLYKISACNIWTEKYNDGYLWIKDLIGNVSGPSQILEKVIETYKADTTTYNNITGGNILDFEVFYDTMLLHLPNKIVFERLNMDFETGEIYSIADQSCEFDVTSSEFAGTWLNEREKVVTFSYLSSGYPIVRSINLDKSKYFLLFGPQSDLTEWDISLDSFDPPQFTYNSDFNTFNLTFMATSASQDVLVISNFSYNDVYSLKIDNVNVVEMPSLSNMKLIKTSAYDDKLLMIFEEQVCPNQIYQIVIDN